MLKVGQAGLNEKMLVFQKKVLEARVGGLFEKVLEAVRGVLYPPPALPVNREGADPVQIKILQYYSTLFEGTPPIHRGRQRG